MVAMSLASCSMSLFRRGGDLHDRVEVVILQVDLVQSPGRGDLHFAAVG